jgi:hypothetical protein
MAFHQTGCFHLFLGFFMGFLPPKHPLITFFKKKTIRSV